MLHSPGRVCGTNKEPGDNLEQFLMHIKSIIHVNISHDYLHSIVLICNMLQYRSTA